MKGNGGGCGGVVVVVVVVVMFFAVQKGPRLQPQGKGSNSLCAKSKTTVYGGAGKSDARLRVRVL